MNHWIISGDEATFAFRETFPLIRGSARQLHTPLDPLTFKSLKFYWTICPNSASEAVIDAYGGGLFYLVQKNPNKTHLALQYFPVDKEDNEDGAFSLKISLPQKHFDEVFGAWKCLLSSNNTKYFINFTTDEDSDFIVALEHIASSHPDDSVEEGAHNWNDYIVFGNEFNIEFQPSNRSSLDAYEGVRGVQHDFSLYEGIRRSHIKDFFNNHYIDEEDIKPGNQVSRWLEDVTSSAAQYAKDNYVSSKDFGSLCHDAINLIRNIMRALKPPTEDFKDFYGKKLYFAEFLRDQYKGLDLIKYDVPYIDRVELVDVSRDYLSKPWRSQKFDWLLVSLLVSVEFFQTGGTLLSETKNWPSWSNESESPLKRRHALRDYLRTIGIVGFFVFILAGGAFWINEAWSWWAVVVFFALGALMIVAETLRLPFTWSHRYRERIRYTEMIQAMYRVYVQLPDQGTISARHIYNQLEESTSKGAIWPPVLFQLLDDILARSGRF